MATFDGFLDLREIGYELWSVLAPFRFTSDDGTVVEIEAGFVTDLASVPALARSIVPKIGYWSQAAVVHDKGYREHRLGNNVEWTRKQVDQWLLQGMRAKAMEYGISDDDARRKDEEIYLAVRMGGLASWETKAERQQRFDRTAQFFNHGLED